MTFTFSELLDDLSQTTHTQLADARITIKQGRPASAINPHTRTRLLDVDTQTQEVDAVEGVDTNTLSGTRWVRSRSWIVLASSLTFIPSKNATVIDTTNTTWRVTKIERRNNHREYEIYAELLS